MKELIQKLAEAYGPSGHEEQVRVIIQDSIRDQVDEIRVDSMGNLIALRRGKGQGKRVILAAHMDEIGLIVTYVDEKGYLRFAPVGGVSPLALTGSRVRFEDGRMGVIGWEKWLESGSAPKWKELFIDVGATSDKDVPVGVGAMAGFVRPFTDLGRRIVGKSLDDRVGCAVAIQALREIVETPNDIYFVFTAQEEVGCRGAVVSAFGIEPEIALAVDVTAVGDTPEATPMAVSLGSGPAIKVMDRGLLAHPGVKELMIRKAEVLGIKYQLEVLTHGSTDASAMQMSRAGVPAGCLSIPCRYVHTPSEMVDYADVLASVKLLSGMLSDQISI